MEENQNNTPDLENINNVENIPEPPAQEVPQEPVQYEPGIPISDIIQEEKKNSKKKKEVKEFGNYVRKSTSMTSNGFEPTVTLESAVFNRKNKTNIVLSFTLFAIILFAFGAIALYNALKPAAIVRTPTGGIAGSEYISKEYQILTRAADLTNIDLYKNNYQSIFGSLNSMLLIPRDTYVTRSQINGVYYDITVNVNKWLFPTSLKSFCDFYREDFYALDTDYTFNKIEVSEINAEVLDSHLNDMTDAIPYEYNDWYFLYEECGYVAGYYELDSNSYIYIYLENENLVEERIQEFVEAFADNITIKKSQVQDSNNINFLYITLNNNYKKQVLGQTLYIDLVSEVYLRDWALADTENTTMLSIVDKDLKYEFTVYEILSEESLNKLKEHYDVYQISKYNYKDIEVQLTYTKDGKLSGILLQQDKRYYIVQFRTRLANDIRVNLDDILDFVFQKVLYIS